jgi:hypothetical protein
MYWETVLLRWERGIYPKFSKTNEEFIWRTSPLKSGGRYQEVFNAAPTLTRPADYSSFAAKVKNKKGYVTDFPNLSGDTILVVPIPRSGEKYSSIFSFNKHASDKVKAAFWKRVAKVARREQRKYGTVFISTHGFGVAWLHVRISKYPKYYENSGLI